MPIEIVTNKRLYRQIAEQLAKLIQRGEFPPGTRLPPERDLATQFGVARASVREALIALELQGLVEIRIGSGIYVLNARPSLIADDNTPAGPLETLRARALIEGQIAATAAAIVNPQQLAGIAEAVELMERDAQAGREPIEGDRLFHLRIAETLGNDVLARVVTQLFDERKNPMSTGFAIHFETPGNWLAAIAEHRGVLDALRAGDGAAARDAMQTHLEHAHDRMTASLR